jgi:hypothetical protein
MMFRVEVGDRKHREVTLVADGAAAELCRRIYDETEDVVQAEQAREYFPRRPELHTAMTLHRALLEAGAEEEAREPRAIIL